LRGKPLLQYTADAALAARQLARVILTTDDPEIATLGERLGLDVPFLRPAELARDDTPTLPVLQHAVRWLEEHENDTYDAICLLQPTNPLRTAMLIDACIDAMSAAQSDSLVTMLEVPPELNPHWVYFQQTDGFFRLSTGESEPIPRRQELPPAFHREGSVYLTRRDVLMMKNSLYGHKLAGYVVPADVCVNIDQESDWERAELLLNGGRFEHEPRGR
jgi:CMP-N-acetylneuraminic acid synthetase